MCHLQECDGELIVWFCGDPHPESFMHSFCGRDSFQQLVHELQTQVTILQKDPASLYTWPTDQGTGSAFILKMACSYHILLN